MAHPIVVMKLVWNESSEKRSSRQLFPTPAAWVAVCPAGSGSGVGARAGERVIARRVEIQQRSGATAQRRRQQHVPLSPMRSSLTSKSCFGLALIRWSSHVSCTSVKVGRESIDGERAWADR